MEKYTVGKGSFRTLEEGLEREWLLTNGMGGFSNSTIINNTARIHSGYLVASLTAPVERFVILSKTQEMLEIGGREVNLATQQYIGYNKEGYKYQQRFELDVVPTYTYQVDDVNIKKTISLEYGKNTVAICYTVRNGMEKLKMSVTPLFCVKDFNSVSEKSELVFDVNVDNTNDRLLKLRRVDNDIKIQFYISDGEYFDRRNFKTSMATPNYLVEENQVYAIDNRNGFMGVDNHITPYDVVVEVEPYEVKTFYCVCTVEDCDATKLDGHKIVDAYKARINDILSKAVVQDDFAQKLSMASDNFVVHRESTKLKTIMAGYPWFADWGRDTMIAFVGNTLCTGRFDDARDILKSFSIYLKNGLIPNVFPNTANEQPQYNTVDASMWYFYAVDKYLDYDKSDEALTFVKEELYSCLADIVEAYKKGTDFSIKMMEDSLITAGSDLDQITWMDVRVGDLVVTPRHGKPVEINALWYNALKVMEKLAGTFGKDGSIYSELSQKVKKSFIDKFWYADGGYLYDVINDVELEFDNSIRPNQIWAVSLPYTMLSEEQQKSIVNVVYKHLYTSYGLRSLSNTDERYKPYYIGKLINRDLAYHMGTTWAFPIGGFITAYCKVNGHSDESIQVAKEMCDLFNDHMNDGCLNGIAEIFDGDYCCTSRGCYSQAWSVGEVLRVYVEDVCGYGR